ncbi:MAG: hypothetical protein ACOC88_03965 [Candidatus Bipolaricaulota bacterium]
MNRGASAIFILTLIGFAASVVVITVPPFTELLSGSPLFLLPFGIFFFLSAALFIIAYKGDLSGKLRGFLLLTGGGRVLASSYASCYTTSSTACSSTPSERGSGAVWEETNPSSSSWA